MSDREETPQQFVRRLADTAHGQPGEPLPDWLQGESGDWAAQIAQAEDYASRTPRWRRWLSARIWEWKERTGRA